MPVILGIDHVQITIAPEDVAAARAFYCDLLGLPEIPKPESLKGRGGFWMQVGDRSVHVGVEDGFDHYQTKAHIAYAVDDVAAWQAKLEDAGVQIGKSIPIPGYVRFECRDPFGNRLEMIQKTDS